jgi:FkbM family methyltransferase
MNKSAAKKLVRALAETNPLTRSLLGWRYQRHLARVVTLDCKQYGAHVTFRKDAVEVRNGGRAMLISRKHAIYAGTLAKAFDVYFSAVIPFDENGIKVADYSKPKVHKLTNGMEFEFSSWPEEIDAIDGYFMWYKPKPGDTVFDLGAHCGFSVYFFSQLVGPGGRVICFEPDPANLLILNRNIERYSLRNVTVVSAAIGAKDGTAQFSSEGTIGSQLVNFLARDTVGDIISVSVMSLRTAFEKFGVPQFCKIDIEGAEIEALESAEECLALKNTHYVVDTNHTVGSDLTDKRVEAIFRRMGYETKTTWEPFASTYARPE